MSTKINLTLPKQWNSCTVQQLELIADVMQEQIKRQDRYHPFSMQNVKIALFFALAGLEIVAGPNPRVPVEEQYYTCRLTSKSRWRSNALIGKKSDTFSLYLWQINYWLSPKAKTNDKNAPEYISQGAALLDWLSNENGMFLTKFPYPLIKRRKRNHLSRKSFQGPAKDLDGFTWAQYRLATEAMQSYVSLSNSLVKMGQMGSFSPSQIAKQTQTVDLARAMFLATIFNRKVNHIDTATGIVKYDYHYESNQITDNAQYFRHFPDTKWQVILFWWTGIMHTLSKRYPRVFKVQPLTKKAKPTTALEIYSATVATMQKYVGLNEKDCNNQSYSIILEQLERIAKESEEVERMRKKK